MSVGYVAVYTTAASSSGGGGGTSCTATATADISADCYSASQGTIDVTSATGGSNPSGVDGNQAAELVNGDYLEYSGINFGTTGSTQFDARVASGTASGVNGAVEVVLDSVERCQHSTASARRPRPAGQSPARGGFASVPWHRRRRPGTVRLAASEDGAATGTVGRRRDWDGW